VVADYQVSAVVKSVNVVCNCNVLRPSGESGGDPDLPPVGDAVSGKKVSSTPKV